MADRIITIQQIFAEGAALLHAGHPAEALIRFQAVRDRDPSSEILHLHIGATLHELGRYEEAVASYRQAVEIAPRAGEIHNNLGNSLMALGRFSEAVDSFSRSSELLKQSPIPVTARATALQALGRIAEAEHDCRRALLLDPSFAAAHWNLALNILLQGRYTEGWQEYEWRWLKPDFTSPCRHVDVSLWDGSPLGGRTILLHAEQGFGDAIQFVRYATLVAHRGGRVIIECHPQLVQLMRTVEGVHEVVPFGAHLPSFSCQAPLLSLPRIFGTTLQTIPARFPYVAVTAEQRRKWAALMPDGMQTLRVGLVWAGKQYPDPLRSCPFNELMPLTTIQNVSCYSLQIGPAGAVPASGSTVIDLTEQINDFTDTAALIEQLDLVISIDTAVAHLAGALGKPVFLMLPFAPDWRWLLERADSPWYPNTRLFRQIVPGMWGDVVNRVHAALKEHAERNKKIL